MLISKAKACSDQTGQLIGAIQFELTDKYSNQTITLDEVGQLSDDPLKCPYMLIDISTDFLASFKLGYNETGVYWMYFTTNKNETRRFG